MKENEYHQSMKGKYDGFTQTDESNFVANSDQSETTLFEETVIFFVFFVNVEMLL